MKVFFTRICIIIFHKWRICIYSSNKIFYFDLVFKINPTLIYVYMMLMMMIGLLQLSAIYLCFVNNNILLFIYYYCVIKQRWWAFLYVCVLYILYFFGRAFIIYNCVRRDAMLMTCDGMQLLVYCWLIFWNENKYNKILIFVLKVK